MGEKPGCQTFEQSLAWPPVIVRNVAPSLSGTCHHFLDLSWLWDYFWLSLASPEEKTQLQGTPTAGGLVVPKGLCHFLCNELWLPGHKGKGRLEFPCTLPFPGLGKVKRCPCSPEVETVVSMLCLWGEDQSTGGTLTCQFIQPALHVTVKPVTVHFL